MAIKWQKAIEAKRLLLLSTFGARAKRVTAALAAERNRFVAAISDEVLIPFAAPGSKTEALALDLLASGKRVYTFSDRPGPLLDAGARLVPPDFFPASRAARAFVFRTPEGQLGASGTIWDQLLCAEEASRCILSAAGRPKD